MSDISTPGVFSPAEASTARDRRPIVLGSGRVPFFRWSFGLINRLVMTCDVAIVVLSSVLPRLLAGDAMPQLSWVQSLLLGIIEALVFVRTMQWIRSYRVEARERLIVSLPLMLGPLLCAWVFTGLYYAAFHSGAWSLDLVWLWHGPQVGALVLARVVERAALPHSQRQALIRRRVAVIGANASGAIVMARMMADDHREEFEIVGLFADTTDELQSGQVSGVPIAGDLDRLTAVASTSVIDLVVVALPLSTAMAQVGRIKALQWVPADVVIPLDEVPLPAVPNRLTDVAGMPVLQVISRPLKGSLALLKLAEDYILASIILAFVSPVLILIGIAIKLDSPGPVFFRQDRAGYGNRTFRIYKFRTMTCDPNDDGSVGTQLGYNPRVTRVGRILRQLSLDEVPQLLNVLLGDMSLVGPRPYVPNMLVEGQVFCDAVENYGYRFRLKPGITGLAQANGLRSFALRSMDNARRSVEMDIEYISRWSLGLDLRIMVKTLVAAMSGPDVF